MRKQFLLAIIIMGISLSCSALSMGDVNNDNSIDILDALFIAKYYVGADLGGLQFEKSTADVNCSNTIDIADALLIAQFYVGLINEFPCSATPFNSPEPTPKSLTYPYSDTSYSYGMASASIDQDKDNIFIKQEYENWKSLFVTEEGAGGHLRVIRTDGNNDTASESIAYGMLFSLYMDEQSIFNSLWAYAKERLDANGLMNWNYDAQGNLKGATAATDADEDMAMALIFADTKWGGNNYKQDALALCRNIMLYEVEANTYVLKPGDAWGGSACTDISYFSPAAYKIFAEFTGDNDWLKVADKCYEIIAAARNKNTYLVPDWCTAQGTHSYEAEASQGPTADYYYYEALRCPLRLSWDYLWFGDNRAEEQLEGMTNFFDSIGPANIKAGYTLDGLKPIGSWHDTAFIATAAAGAMEGSNTNFSKKCFSEMKNTKSYHYYEDSIRLFSLLVASGNFPDLYHN